MDLVTILLMIVALLMVLFGILVLIGGVKKERIHLAWFLIAMLGGAVWTVSNGLQIWNTTGDSLFSAWISYGICQGSVVAALGLFGYYLQVEKIRSRILTMLVASVASLIIILLPFLDFETLNSVLRGENSWFYTIYSIFLTVLFVALLANAVIRIKRIDDKKGRKSSLMLFLGTLATVSISIVFNMIFPFALHSNEFLWIGPLSIYILVLAFYLNLFSTHRITLSSAWFKILSYIILIVSFVIIYMILFFVVFTSLFHVASPSFSVILLNLIMVVIILLLIPTITEISSLVKSLITLDQVDVGYVVKKLNKLRPEDVNLQELSDFLVNHLHCEYIGFVINKRLYESESSEFNTDTLKAISALKPAKHGIWQDLNNHSGQILAKQKIIAVAELCDDKDNVFGQMLIGKPLRKYRFDRKDLIHLELVVNLIATLLSYKKSVRK